MTTIEELKEVFQFFDLGQFIEACLIGMGFVFGFSGFALLEIYERWWPMLMWIIGVICLAIAFAM